MMTEFLYLRVMTCSMTAGDRFEAVNADFVEPSVYLFHEVRLWVSWLRWWAGCPRRCEVLAHGKTAYVALRGPVVGRGAMVGPTLGSSCQLIVPNLREGPSNLILPVSFPIIQKTELDSALTTKTTLENIWSTVCTFFFIFYRFKNLTKSGNIKIKFYKIYIKYLILYQTNWLLLQ